MEFNLVQSTTRAPFNKCYLCGSHAGPFIDTFFDQFGVGAVYLCATKYGPTGEVEHPGCVGVMANMAGYRDAYEVSLMRDLIAELQARIVALEALDRNIIIPEGELRQYIQNMGPIQL